MISTSSKFRAGLVSEETQPRRGWFVVLGFILLILAVLAFGNLFAVTVAAVLFIGTLLILGGIIQIVEAFQVKIRRGFFGWILGGVLYATAGLIAVYKPFLAAVVLTLVLELALVASGVVRAWSGIQSRSRSGLRRMVASGVTTALAGIVFASGWPENSLIFLGTMLAADMTIQGVSAIASGVARESVRLAEPDWWRPGESP